MIVEETRGNHPVSVRLIDEHVEWDRLAPDWDRLFERSPYSSPPLRFDWLRTWWRVYGKRGDKLWIITVWRGQNLLGGLPLYERRVGQVVGLRRLGFLSTGEAEHEETCPDYLNLLCLPGEEAACLNAVRVHLRNMVWDHLELLDMPENSPLMQLGEGLAGEKGMQVVPRGHCPIGNLEAGFDSYFENLSAKTRQQARRAFREADRSGAVLELANDDDVEQFFGDLICLHQERWIAEGKPGCFASPRFTEFHDTLARKWVPGGTAVLARLSVNNQPLAVLYGFVNGAKFDEYQTGVKVNASDAIHSPGILARLLLMKRLSERGITRYDFLRGSRSYKISLATEATPLVALHAWRPTIRSKMFAVSDLIGRVSRKGAKFLFGK